MTTAIETIIEITPMEALYKLKEGNFRFINNHNINRDLLNMVDLTKDGQRPYAVILSCMDSRTSVELIFDQGVGDVFSIRIAGNVVTDSIIGSLEYATAVAGSALIVVMGHTGCGAIKGACDGVKMGKLTGLLEHIQPAVQMEQSIKTERNSNNAVFVDAVTRLNVHNSIRQIVQNSTIISDLIDAGKVNVVPAIYNVATGKVSFGGTAVG